MGVGHCNEQPLAAYRHANQTKALEKVGFFAQRLNFYNNNPLEYGYFSRIIGTSS
jgi:hypothetical protein